jgi:FixJ family two-component response regulator
LNFGKVNNTKMNRSNKEIAPLLDLSVRGVETARHRVRKRLKVQETNFIILLESLSESLPKE